MPVKLHRCKFEWLKTGACWRVEKALKEMNIDYELAPGPSRPSRREEIIARTGQKLYPAIEFENGVWYRRGVEGHGSDDPRRDADGACCAPCVTSASTRRPLSSADS